MRYALSESMQFNAFESLYAITRVKRNIRNSRYSSNGPSRDLPQKNGGQPGLPICCLETQEF